MESSSGSSKSSNGWLVACITTIGMAVFAGLHFFSKPPAATQLETKIVTNLVTHFVTNEIIREVPKEVEKIVMFPAEIPEEYVHAFRLWQRMTNATEVFPNGVLFGMKDVRTVVRLSDDVKENLSEETVKAKFELTLRRNNVPLNPNSENTLVLNFNGFFAENKSMLIYLIKCSVPEKQQVFREGECHVAAVEVWREASFGIVGRHKITELLPKVENVAELFANDYLTANPKPK